LKAQGKSHGAGTSPGQKASSTYSVYAGCYEWGAVLFNLRESADQGLSINP
jgi:hypothetical protein